MSKQMLFDLWRTTHSPLRMPWFYRDPELDPFRVIELQQAWINDSIDVRTSILYIKAFLWPVISALKAAKLTWSPQGTYVKRIYNISHWQQWRTMSWNANRFNLHPNYYFSYRLFEDDNKTRVSKYFFKPIFNELQRYLSDPLEIDVVADKISFYHHCKVHNLQTPTVYWVQHGSRIQVLGEIDPTTPIESDLFLKPTSLSGGRGAQLWRYTPSTKTYGRYGQTLTWGQLCDHVRQISQIDPYMVTKRAEATEEFYGWTQGALPTYRVITYRNVQHSPTVLFAVLRLPVGETDVDNTDSGGISAPVRGVGTLGPAMANDIARGNFLTHPDTQAHILGAKAPGFAEICQLCLKAHDTLPNMFSVGWDAAMTKDGPVLIEANSTWSPNTQARVGIPIGLTGFVDAANRVLQYRHFEELGESRINGVPAAQDR